MRERERPPLAKAAGSEVNFSAYRVPTENRHSCPSCIERDERSTLFADELCSEQDRKAGILADLSRFDAERRMHFESIRRALANGRVDVDFADLETVRGKLELVEEAERFLVDIGASLAAEATGTL